MRFLHVTHQYPPAIGGSEKYIADISEELVRRGHQVDVFTSRSLNYRTWRNALPPFERRNGVNVYRFRAMQRRKWVWRVLHFGLRHYRRTRSRRYEPFIFFGGGPLSPGMAWAMLKQGRQYDLIHLNCLVYAPAVYGYWIARRLNIPIVITPHAHADQEETYNIGYQRAVLQGCNHVLADTAAERTFLVEAGVEGWRITTGGTGLRPEAYPAQDPRQARRRLGLPEDAFVLLFLGRKTAYKGFDLLLKAFKTLRPRYPHLRFLTVGPGTEFSQALMDREPAPPGFLDLGAVSEETKLAALGACDCLALPSTGEAFGIVFLEAWIMGKPVIGVRMPAVSTIINHGRDGFLIAPGDIGDLTSCLVRLLENPELGRSMGRRGREKVLRRYTVPRITDIVEGVYHRTLRQHHAQHRGGADQTR